MFSTPDVQAAHAPGVMRIAFSASGKKIITAGEDGVVRVWKAHIAGEKEPKNVTELRERVNALAASNGVWASGGDDAMVKKFSDATDSMLSSITQTGGLPVRCLAFSPKGDRIAVGSDDLVVKVVDVEDTLQCALLTGHTKGLRALTWHPSGNLLTTTSQDGKILVWDCQQSPPKKVHELDGLVTHCLEPDLVEFSYIAAAVWHPNGGYFVTATPTHEIAIISKNGWTKTGTFSVDGHASEITSLAFSSNGNYLASTGKDNQIIIWDTESKRPVLRHQSSGSTMISVSWSPTSGLLAWCDLHGGFGRWEPAVPSSRPSFSLGESESKKKVTGRNAALDALMAGEDEEEGDDTAMDGDVVEAERDYDEDEQWVEDDIGEEYTKDKERFEEGTREMVSVTKAQPAFQPGSTPFKGRKCYFAFNSIGVIEVSDLEIHQVINVEFHDKSLRHDYHFQDTDVFTMAALGERGVAFASRSAEGASARVAYRPYDTWASNADWKVDLAPGEEPIAIATGGLPYSQFTDDNDLSGNGNVAVATSKGYVRFFTGGGVQRYVWTVGGEVVAMAAGAEWTFVVHREGGTRCQNLRYSLISLDAFDIIQTGYLPLPRKKTLLWIGISEEGAPAMYDSAGMLSVLDRFRRPTQGRWVPLLDTNTLARKAGKDEYYWPVSLSSKELLCVILKGGERYPGFPRPMIQEIEMQMPLLNLDAPQGQAEERFLRQSIHVTMQKDAADASTSSIAKQELELDKTLIQLIQLACKADKLQAALDLTRLLHHNASFESARKVAGFYHLIGLQERMGMLKDSKDLEEGDEEGFNPRKNWGKVMEPVGRGYQPNGASGSSSSKANFDDFGPPPAITRRTLARAVPVGEVAFARPPAPALTGRPSVPPPAPQFSEDSSMEIDPDITFGDSESLPTTSAKRKWDDGLAANGIGAGSGEGPSTKKRTAGSGTTMVTSGAAVPFAPPQGGPPKAGANANPFARKPGAEKPPNPFARGANGNKSIVKSNSFFEKVDAAEADAANGKRKGKAKESSSKGKQTTLFGLPAVSKDKDNKAGGKKARARDKDEDGAENVKANEGEPESQEQEESQGEMTDLTSTATDLLGDTQLEEGDTQLDDAQAVEAREPSPDWDLGEEEIEA